MNLPCSKIPDHVLDVVAEAQRQSVPLAPAELDAYFGADPTEAELQALAELEALP